MINTLSLREIEKYADNIYEAIIVLAKRARQINDEQKQLYQREGDYEAYDDYEDEDLEVTSEDTDYLRLPKPTSLALEELLSGKLQYTYHEPDEEEATEGDGAT